MLHNLVKSKKIKCIIAASGQKRFDLKDIQEYEKINPSINRDDKKIELPKESVLSINNSTQKIFIKNAMNMDELKNDSIHLMVTSPPYFDTKMYSKKPIKDDLGNIHDLDEWFEKISIVWKEVFRVLQPGRKAFINIISLPVRDNGGFRSLNLVYRIMCMNLFWSLINLTKKD